jgi:hypothetical protein
MPCTRGRRFRDDLVWSLAAGMIDRPGRLVAVRTSDSPPRDAARLVPLTRLAEAIRVGNASRASHGSP